MLRLDVPGIRGSFLFPFILSVQWRKDHFLCNTCCWAKSEQWLILDGGVPVGCSWRVSPWWKETWRLLLLLLSAPVFGSSVPSLGIMMGWLHIPGTFGLIWMIKENQMCVLDTCQLAIIIVCISIMSFSKNFKAPCLWKYIYDREEEIIIFILQSLRAVVGSESLVVWVTIVYPRLCCMLKSPGDL